MWNFTFVWRNCIGKGHGTRRNFFGVFERSSVIEVSQDKSTKREWPKGGTNRYAAIFILAKCQMGIWMMYIYELFRIVTKIETDRERNDISSDDLGVRVIIDINLWRVLKILKVRGREI